MWWVVVSDGGGGCAGGDGGDGNGGDGGDNGEDDGGVGVRKAGRREVSLCPTSRRLILHMIDTEKRLRDRDKET